MKFEGDRSCDWRDCPFPPPMEWPDKWDGVLGAWKKIKKSIESF